MSIAFPPRDFGFLAWIGLSPYFILLYGDIEPRKALNYGFAWGCTFFGCSLYWFYNAVGPLGFLLIAILSIFPAVASWVIVLVRKKMGLVLSIIFTPVLWTGIEFFRSELWKLKFSWMALGYSQHNYPGIIQISDIVGVYGVTFILVFANSAVALLIISMRMRKTDASGLKHSLIFASITLLLLAISCIYGRYTMNTDYGNSRSINIMGVQRDSIVSDLLKDTLEALKSKNGKVDLIVWPEYSVPLFLDESQREFDGIATIAKEYNTYFLFGGKEKAEKDVNFNSFYNTAFLVSPKGTIVGRAVKMNPIQFFNDGLPGRRYSVFQTDTANIGVGICYDMDYTDVSRKLTARGADILIYPTDDLASWGHIQHLQHASMTPFRAIENRRSIFRVASSGFSQMADAHGRIISAHGIDYKGGFINIAALGNYVTIYNRFGYLFSWLCLILTIAVVLYSLLFIRQPRSVFINI